MFTVGSLACLIVGIGASVPPKCASGKECPHIFFMMIDDLGWNNVPWHNPDLVDKMPHSLELVKEGVELDRHYAFLFCSPSRSSFLSGRLPYHVNQVNLGTDFKTSGVHPKMTTIPRKLKDAGYATHHVGKWHAGNAYYSQTPHGRGFDTALGYFAGAEDHWTQRQCIDGECNKPDNLTSTLVDLWLTDRPAYNRNGTYGDKQFTEFVIDSIKEHPVDTPMFYYIAMQNNHEPLQAPQEYVDRFPSEWSFDRRYYAAMGAYWDEAIGNITNVLKARGMWEHTLMVLSSDNGGPVYPSASLDYPHCGGANNYPLFGGKVSNWEGGVRVAAFASGGVLPPAVRGTKLEGNVHIADWYATFCGLAGVDPSDVVTGIPDVDSVDVWPLVSGANATSPRYEIPLSIDFETGNKAEAPGKASALIVGDFKLLTGIYATSIRQKQAWPDHSACCNIFCWAKQRFNCDKQEGGACLFNIREDPTETYNLAASKPELVQSMLARISELNHTVFRPQSGDVRDPEAKAVAEGKYRGFVGPWLGLPETEQYV